MSPRPLFLPLKACYFRAFELGEKRIEWRHYGPRWNRQNAYRGRPLTLSLGYSGARLTGAVVRSRRVPALRAPQLARDLYPTARYFCAIHVALDRAGMARKSRAD